MRVLGLILSCCGFLSANTALGQPEPFDTSEIRYDDGGAETWYTPGWDNNDKAAVRFSSPVLVPPCRILRARIMFDQAGTIGYVLLCRGSFSEPDTTPGGVYQRIDNVSTAAQPAWTIVNFDSNLCRINTQYTWLVMCWPNSSGGPGIGGDQSFPINNNSAWYSEDFGWITLTNMDLLMRILASRPNYDVTPVSVDRPGTGVWVDTSYEVRATIRNQGLYPASYPVYCYIRRADTFPVFTDTYQVTNHAAGTNLQIAFSPNWMPQVYDGRFTVTIRTDLSNDYDRTNDSLGVRIFSYGPGEIAYDDFVPETWRVVGLPTDSNHYLAVKFTPYLTLADYVRFRIYVNSTAALKNVKLCPDSSGRPNLLRPHMMWNNLQAPTAPGWIDVSFLVGSPAGDQWLTANYHSAGSGPSIGADTTAPINGRSYFSSNAGATWTQIANQDLVMRVFHRSGGAVAEAARAARSRIVVSGNPVRGAFRVAAPTDDFRISFYDIAGTKLREIESVGRTGIGWDFRNAGNRRLPAGVYFYKIVLDRQTITGKIVKIK